MGWETRERGRSYYYRSRWVNGRPVKEYIGTGPVAELVANLDEQTREQRQAARAEAREWRAQIEAADGLIDRLCRGTDGLARAALQAAGYHQHARGAWRKRRGEGHGHPTDNGQ